MSVTTDIDDATSALRKFLDARLPDRAHVAQEWAEQLESSCSREPDDSVSSREVGVALELRIGLDLAERPARWELLTFLPPEICAALLEAVGFVHDNNPYLMDTATKDPLLRFWIRASHPINIDAGQEEALGACLDAAELDEFEHKIGPIPSVEHRRTWFHTVFSKRSAGRMPPPNPLLRCWKNYLKHGRAELLSLGDRVVVAPRLAPGYGTADLVIGGTLIDIKTSPRQGIESLARSLDQVLAYVLLDRTDLLRLDAVALYLAWEGLLFTSNIHQLLRVATPGITPSLASLRLDLHEAMKDRLDEKARFWYESRLNSGAPFL